MEFGSPEEVSIVIRSIFYSSANCFYCVQLSLVMFDGSYMNM